MKASPTAHIVNAANAMIAKHATIITVFTIGLFVGKLYCFISTVVLFSLVQGAGFEPAKA